MKSIKVNYNGSYPNLCSGDLTVEIEGETWIFPDYCLRSGGDILFDEEDVTEGEWSIREDKWPKDFPENMKKRVLKKINKKIPHGCCGGCLY